MNPPPMPSTFYGGLSWRGAMSNLDLNAQHGDSYLVGNGAIPEELLAVRSGRYFHRAGHH